MYKASFAAGEKWFEWIKMRPSQYAVYRINGDGSHTHLDMFARKSLAKKYCQFLNSNYATDGGKSKAGHMSDGDQFLNKEDLAKYAPSAWENGNPVAHAKAVAIAAGVPF